MRSCTWLVLIVLVGCGAREEQAAARPKPRPAAAVAITVEPPHEIAPGEDLRAVRVASPMAPDMREADTVCVIYRNEAMKTAQLVCPDGPPDISHLSAGAPD